MTCKVSRRCRLTKADTIRDWIENRKAIYLYGWDSILDAHSDHEHLSVKDLVAAVEATTNLVLAVFGR